VWRVRFTLPAAAELTNAQDWYEKESPGLGGRFRGEINKAVERMAAMPQQFPIVHKNVRRARVKVFPYSLFFVMDHDELLVIACFHSRRSPKRWQLRS
jgi:plasmid stabilization system protein ParE